MGLLQGRVVCSVAVIGIVKPKTVVLLKGSLVIHLSGFLTFLAFVFAVTQDNKNILCLSVLAKRKLNKKRILYNVMADCMFDAEHQRNG